VGGATGPQQPAAGARGRRRASRPGAGGGAEGAPPGADGSGARGRLLLQPPPQPHGLRQTLAAVEPPANRKSIKIISCGPGKRRRKFLIW